MDGRLAGGNDGGAERVGETVRRRAGVWTPSVQHLLAHLAERGFDRAPRPLGVDAAGREVLSHLPGRTVGTNLPWPRWVHGEAALLDVAHWLRAYHRAVSDYVPPPHARWREEVTWRPGLVLGHQDAAPYNAVWDDDGLVGFVDWDMAGPVEPALDLAWVAFAWVPLHARHVVAAEGFTDLGSRRPRLESFLAAYGWQGGTDEVLALVARRVDDQVALVEARAASGDPTYTAMHERGRVHDLRTARAELTVL